jgi:transposase
MVTVPTLAEEDAKRPSREREPLVGEASRIITRLKAAFVRLGIRSFNPKLKAAANRLATLRTPQGEPIPPWVLRVRSNPWLRADIYGTSMCAAVELALRSVRVTRAHARQNFHQLFQAAAGTNSRCCGASNIVGLRGLV